MSSETKHKLVIRNLREADLPALEWDGEYRHFKRLYRQMYEQMRRGRRLMLIAEFDDDIIGQAFIQFFIHRDELEKPIIPGYLHAVRVKPPFRNRGIGTQMIRIAEQVMAHKGMNCSVIAVEIDNLAALRLYERLGYERFAEDDGAWSYVDHRGERRFVSQPAHLLKKHL